MREAVLPCLPTDPIDPVLEVLSDDLQFKQTVGKIKGLLYKYAEHKGINFNGLRMMDVFNSHKEIASNLLVFINSMKQLRNQPPKRLKQYQNEIRSNLRRVAKHLFGASLGLQAGPLHDARIWDSIPEMLHPALPHLPREVKRQRMSLDERMNFPLTDRGQIMLAALIKVYEAYKPSTLESLIVDLSPAVFQATMALAPSDRKNGLAHLVRLLKKRLGFKSKLQSKHFLEKSEWPLKLRQEWETFEKLALQGSASGCLSNSTPKRSVGPLKRFSPITIQVYEVAISCALGVISFDPELCILDFIKMTSVKEPPDGGVESRKKNSLIDYFQQSERAKQGRVKNVGYDSNVFRQFICAVKAIAINNGYGSYVKALTEAYPIALDKASTEQRKADLKATFTISWVDEQIAKLLPRFRRIINTASFKRRADRLRRANHDLFFIFFYICLVTLRYMGYRQQSLVSCKVGENFTLNPDRSITLRFNKTKNNRRLYMKLDESRKDTHGLLMQTLLLYYKKVYPYLVQESGNTLNGHFFVIKRNSKFLFSGFKGAHDFSKFFKEGCRKFLPLDAIESPLRDYFHAHFLRGLCTDWLITILHMTFDEAGEVIGDDPTTLKRKYVDKNRVSDAGVAFDTARARLRMLEENVETQNQLREVLNKLDSVQALLNQKERELASLR